MTQGTTLRFRLAISADEYLAYYRREAQDVVTRALDGRVVQFPASTLRAHVTHVGVFGLFELVHDERGKLLSFERVGD